MTKDQIKDSIRELEELKSKNLARTVASGASCRSYYKLREKMLDDKIEKYRRVCRNFKSVSTPAGESVADDAEVDPDAGHWLPSQRLAMRRDRGEAAEQRIELYS